MKFDRDTWQTPPWLYAWLDSLYGFNLDAAASDEHHLCDKFFTKENSALNQDWGGAGTVAFCNPPYSRGMKEKFLNKAVEQRTKGVTSVFVIPSLPSEGWFPHDTANHIMFIKGGRVNFIHPVTNEEMNGVPAGTAMVVFNAKTLSTNVVITSVERDLIKAAGNSILNLERDAA